MLLAAMILAANTAGTTPAIPIGTARRYFEEIRLAAEEDGGHLWGTSLAGPMIFVDPKTRFAVANMPDSEGKLQANGGVFAGTLPDSVVLANTATTWSGVRWTMVMWSSISERSVPRRRLLFHESFHRIQEGLGFPASNSNNPHLDTLDGRYWLLLEYRALAAALRAPTAERTAAIRDALLFRATRRAIFADAAERERLLENNEGLAECTGFALRGTADVESRLAAARRLDPADRETSFVRSFAYDTGPAYGLLLDAAAPSWRTSYKVSDDLAAILGKAAKIDLPSAPQEEAARRAQAYGGAELRVLEEQRDREQRARLAKYRALLIDGPVLELPMKDANWGFDPNEVVPLDGSTVYPTLSVTAPWGKLEVQNGVRVTSDFRSFVVSAPAEANGNPVRGNGWTLELKAGWKIVSGTRKGDYHVEGH